MSKRMPVSFEKLVQEMDAAIRRGDAGQARAQLQGLLKLKIPREFRVKLANLARRAGQADFAVRLLRPIVRPAARTVSAATADEVSEYAASLLKLGAAAEAEDLLSTVDTKRAPQALLYLGFAKFATWKYSDSIPYLKEYSQSDVDPYQRQLGKLNLGAALVHERNVENALEVLSDLRVELETSPNNRMLSNLLLCWAELEIERGNFSQGERLLAEAEEKLKDSQGMDMFFVTKWRAISVFKQKPKENIATLNKMQAEAKRQEHWETVRDCDRYIACTLKDAHLFEHLYFGTPHENFRQMLRQDWGSNVTLNPTYRWRLNGGGKLVDLLSLESRGYGIKPGQLNYRLLATLSSDFYRPFRLAELHSAIFPRDYYNPVTSPLRVHQAIFRLRKVLTQKKLPITLTEENKSYRLSSTAGVQIPVSNSTLGKDNFEIAHDRLQEHFPNAFTVAEAADFLDASHAWAYKIVRNAMGKGKMVREGSNPRFKYRFSVSTKKAA